MKRFLLYTLFLMPAIGPADEITVDERDPVTIITEASTEILDILESKRAEFTESPELLISVVRENMLPLIDVVYSARLVLGRAGRGVSRENLLAFSNALSSVLINRYSTSLIEFSQEERIHVLPLKGKNSDKLTRVRTRVKLDRGGSVPVDFAFHNTDTGWKIFDVTVEGISYVITFRNQIAPRVQTEGIEKVTAEIIAGNVTFDE